MARTYGLGMVQSPPDDRDYLLAPKLTAALLPRKYQSNVKVAGVGQLYGAMPPVLNQDGTPQCVAYATTAQRMWQENRDGHGMLPFDPAWLYAQCKLRDGNTLDGTTGRQALGVTNALGMALKLDAEVAHHFKTQAYYAVPLDRSLMKLAIVQFGPILVGGPWDEAWFTPLSGGVLPKPSGTLAGGHERLRWGWNDDLVGGCWLERNSWGPSWGMNGNCYVPYQYDQLWEAWKSLDIAGD